MSAFEKPSEALGSVLFDLRKLCKIAQEEEPEEIEEEEEEEAGEGLDPIEVLHFFHENPNPSDEDFHAWVEERGGEPDDAEEIVYRFVTDFAEFVFGGKSKGGVPDNLDYDQLSKGIEVELEHTPNKAMAAKIAIDHLTESPIYYDALAKMEASLKGGAKEE